MPRYFAELDKDGVVIRVIVASSLEWCVENLGGTWKETFMDDPNKNYAGIGHKHDLVKDNFIAEKPFESWVLNEKDRYEAPVAPKEGDVKWDEENTKWITAEELTVMEAVTNSEIIK